MRLSRRPASTAGMAETSRPVSRQSLRSASSHRRGHPSSTVSWSPADVHRQADFQVLIHGRHAPYVSIALSCWRCRVVTIRHHVVPASAKLLNYRRTARARTRARRLKQLSFVGLSPRIARAVPSRPSDTCKWRTSFENKLPTRPLSCQLALCISWVGHKLRAPISPHPAPSFSPRACGPSRNDLASFSERISAWSATSRAARNMLLCSRRRNDAAAVLELSA
jgi:hypothetical protein